MKGPKLVTLACLYFFGKYKIYKILSQRFFYFYTRPNNSCKIRQMPSKYQLLI